jgi:hypothetical protein
MAIESMRKTQLILGTLALSLASTSCWRQRAQARVFIPPAPRPQATVPDTQPVLPAPPRIEADLASIAPPGLLELAPDIAGEMPDAPKRVARRPVPVVAPPKPALPQGPAAPEPVAPPKLAQMFTPEELRANTRALDESLERVNRALAIVEGKNLTPDQKEMAERIRTFRKQAEQAREQDLLTAVSLARRADLLAKDLIGRLP